MGHVRGRLGAASSPSGGRGSRGRLGRLGSGTSGDVKLGGLSVDGGLLVLALDEVDAVAAASGRPAAAWLAHADRARRGRIDKVSENDVGGEDATVLMDMNSC
jgi:hypothetical protein